MKNLKILWILVIILFIISCSGKEGKVDKNSRSFKEIITRIILYPLRLSSGISFYLSKKKRLAKDLYRAVYRATSGFDIHKVKEVLEAGADPNYCLGECGWVDSNPLNVVAESFYTTYFSKEIGEKIPNPAPDVETLNILIKFGADINRRPYV